MQVRRHAGRRNASASEKLSEDVNLDGNGNALEGLQREYHARTSDHQQQAEQVQEHRGHERGLRHVEEDAEADARQREPGHVTRDGPPAL